MTIPLVDETICTNCKACVDSCPLDILVAGETAVYVSEADECVKCGSCVSDCPVGALTL